MQKFAKIQIGLPFLDQKWGGVYPGGNYIILGTKKSGKTFLALKIIEKFIQSGLTAYYLTNQRKKNIEIQAASLYFDIEESIKNGSLIFADPTRINKSIENLCNEIENSNPTLVVIDDLVYNSIITSPEDYINILEILEKKNILLFSVSSIPQNENDKNLLKEIVQFATGIIQLRKTSDKRNYSGQITIKPNVGHIEGEFETTYKIEPGIGFVTLADSENKILNMLSRVSEDYHKVSSKKDFEYSNVYDYEEFKILIESKKSFVKNTNKEVFLISYEIKNGTLETIELANVLKSSLNEEDKISYKEKMIYIFPKNNSEAEVQKMLAQLDKSIENKLNDRIDTGKMIARRKQLLTSNYKLI